MAFALRQIDEARTLELYCDGGYLATFAVDDIATAKQL